MSLGHLAPAIQAGTHIRQITDSVSTIIRHLITKAKQHPMKQGDGLDFSHAVIIKRIRKCRNVGQALEAENRELAPAKSHRSNLLPARTRQDG
jgi:hypothetical protein